MDTQSRLLTTEVAFEGKTFTASYFIERDIIQASIEGRLYTTTLGYRPAEETVRGLLLEWVLHNSQR